MRGKGFLARTAGKLFKRSDYYDYSLLAVVIILICFGLVMLYSASAYEAATKLHNDMYYFGRQAGISFAAIVLAIVVSLFDYRKLIKWAPVLYILSIILMAMVKFSPLGFEALGARRWLDFKIITFQPSEIAKIAVILLAAYMIARMGRKFGTFRGTMLVFITVAIPAVSAFFFTENLSTAIIIMGIGVIMIFVAHPKTKWFLILFGAALGIVILILILMRSGVIQMEGFRFNRVLVWMNPKDHLSDGGYQVMQGLYAIGSGGFFGKGLGNSTQKITTIPEAQNDMIFSIICEELGLFGAIILLLLFGYLLYRLFFIAQNAPDRQGTLIATGIFAHIALQVVLNICVVLNVIPTTGVTLPFVSYGGTSVLFLMIEIGLALNVSRQIRFTGEEPAAPKARGRSPGRAQRGDPEI